MAKFGGQGETPRDDQEQHRKLDQLLASDYADVVHSLLEILYQRMLELRQADRPDR
jgi:hypothetical protein